MKILIVKLSSLGDIVHTLPSLAALRNAYPDAEIDWLVEEESEALLEGNPLISNVVAIKKRGLLREPGKAWKIVRRLRQRRYDMVLDFQGLMKSAIWVGLSSGKRRIGFGGGREFSHLFLNEKLPPYDRDRHAVDRYLDLARYAGGKGDDVRFPLFLTPEEKETVVKLLEEGGVAKGESYIVLSPKARWETKLWGAERFGTVAREIVRKMKIKVVVIGGRADRLYGETIASFGHGIVNLAGVTTLKEAAQLMKGSRLVVSVDSGPLHIASAVGVPVIALFGPTAPWRTGPYGSNNIVIRGSAECSPCFSKQCDDPFCMKDITVTEVMGAVTALMEAGEELAPSSEREREPEKKEKAIGCDNRD